MPDSDRTSPRVTDGSAAGEAAPVADAPAASKPASGGSERSGSDGPGTSASEGPGGPESGDSGSPHGSGDAGPYAALAGLFVVSTAAAAYEIAPASVTISIMEGLGIGPSTAGWLISVMYATAVVTSVPVGVALDRTSVRRAVTAASLALVVAGAGGYLAAAGGAFGALLATRVLGGLVYVTVWNAGANLAGRVGPGGGGTAVAVFTASAPAGFALGQFGAPLVAGAAGWPAIFPAFAAVSLAGLALYRWGAARIDDGGALDAGSPDPGAFAAVFRSRAVWTVCAMGFAAFSLYLFLNSWLPTFLVDRLDLTLATGGLLAALFPAVGVVARTGGGVVSDRLFGGRRRPVAVLSFAVSAPVVVAIAFVGSVGPAVGLLVTAGAAIQLGIGLLFAYVREVVDPAVAGTAVSLLTGVGLLGAFVAPITAGSLIELTGAYQASFLAAGAVAVAGVALAALAPEPAR